MPLSNIENEVTALNDELRLTPRKGDLLAVFLVIALAIGLSATLALRARSAQHASVEIYRDGTLIQEVSLGTDQCFEISGDYVNTVTVQDGKIAITSSTCPGSDCVHSGWVQRAGQAIICLPNRVEIRLIGTVEPGGIDAIAG